MISKREARRETLRIALIEAAKARIATNGLAGLRARDIATDAGCALGGLYNVFENLDDLILHINSATLAQLNEALGQAAANAHTPQAKLVTLAHQYMTFAIDHHNLWSALFDHRLPKDIPVPPWHLGEHGQLFSHVVAPISALKPELDEEELLVTARTLYAAVHGIVANSLRDGFIAIPREILSAQLTEFINTHVKGMTGTGSEQQT